jgi:tetratricopeptide (TPR) repeat protein
MMFRVALGILILVSAAVPAVCAIGVDQTAPDFKAADIEGNVRTLDEFSGKATVVLFWRPEAERARNAVCEVADAIQSAYEDTHLVTIVSGEHDLAEIESVLEHCGRPVAALLDLDRSIFAAYKIIALPTLVVLSSDHEVKYKEAGFSHEGIAYLTAQLDEIYGRKQPVVALPEGSPEAIRRYGLAMQFLKKGLRERAEDLLAQLVEDHPEYRPAWVSLGYCRIELGKVEESRECLEKAYSLDRENPDVAAGLAWIWREKGNRAESEKWAAIVDENDPNSNLIHAIRADPVK